MGNNTYRVLDSGNFRKLEQVGPWRISRPALNAVWKPTLPESQWNACDAVFHRKNDGSGSWDFKRKLPESWVVDYAGFNIKVKPTGFGHLGFFAEQYRNWNFFREEVKTGDNALNLFGYSGIGSMAFAANGANVCHLDASRGRNEWGREILALNPNIPDNIRWITDDVKKFTTRETRRGSHYNWIALDPPSFGRGAKGEVWKIETDLPKLLETLSVLRDPDRPFTLILSCHSPGFSISSMERLVVDIFGKGEWFDSFEMTIPEESKGVLPAGISVRWRG